MEGRYSTLFTYSPLYSYLSLKWPGHLLWKVRNPRQGGCPFSTVDRHGCAHASRISKTHRPVENQRLLLLFLPLVVLLNFRFFLSLKNKSIIVLVISFSYKKIFKISIVHKGHGSASKLLLNWFELSLAVSCAPNFQKVSRMLSLSSFQSTGWMGHGPPEWTRAKPNFTGMFKTSFSQVH